MKQYIVLASMIALGIFIFALIAGPSEDSVASSFGKALKTGTERMVSE